MLIFRPMISLNINIKCNIYFITSVILKMTVLHFTAQPIARNQFFRLVIVGYSVQNQPKTYYLR